jgi:hypothetical protein
VTDEKRVSWHCLRTSSRVKLIQDRRARRLTQPYRFRGCTAFDGPDVFGRR